LKKRNIKDKEKKVKKEKVMGIDDRYIYEILKRWDEKKKKK
jgi:hypothetical protein